MAVPKEVQPFGDLTAEETYAEYRRMQSTNSQPMLDHLVNLFFTAGQTGDKKTLSRAELWKQNFIHRCEMSTLF